MELIRVEALEVRGLVDAYVVEHTKGVRGEPDFAPCCVGLRAEFIDRRGYVMFFETECECKALFLVSVAGFGGN